MSTPSANNKLNSLGTFFQRSRYGKESFATIPISPIDLWKQKKLFGRVDFDGNAVFPSQSFLKPITSIDDQKFVLHFVADAFEELRLFILQAKFKGKLSNNSDLLSNLVAVSGWENINELYNDYLKTLFQNFISFVEERNKKEHFFSIKSFLHLIFEFFTELSSKNFPISRTAFIKSKFCSPHISGLMIEIATEQHDDDQLKVQKFLKDENFTFFIKAARKFGFKVDKNAPWRLIADISSPNLKRFLLQNNISLDNIFEKVYYKSYQLDRQMFEMYIWQFFNSYVEANNVVRQERVEGKNRLFEKRSLNQIPFEVLVKELDEHWIKLISSIRINEEHIDRHGFDQLVEEVQKISQLLGERSALTFLNEKIKTGIITKKNVRLDHF